MICETCFCMLRGQVGRQLMGSFDLQFDHQRSEGSLKQAADTGCCICRRLWEDLTRSDYRFVGRARGQGKRSTFLYANLHELKKLPWPTDLYLLNFRLSNGPRLSSFVLEQLSTNSLSVERRYTPSSQRLDSPEVLKLAKFWLRTCLRDHEGCTLGDVGNISRSQHQRSVSVGDNQQFYPTRLIELNPEGAVEKLQLENIDPETKKPKLRLASTFRKWEEVEPRHVRLIVTKSASHMGNKDGEPDIPDGSYVTLSHCWGKGRKILSLQSDNINQYRNQGIPTRELPRTFRQAIRFARRLDPDVKYIWIDSLCIMQDNDDDWKHEAAQMYQVYRNSYCNISATAAMDGSEGLYAERDPRTLWETEINVNGEIEIPGMRSLGDGTMPGSQIRRCNIIDPNLWNLKVDDAPINRRAWVLQERLLAPRVIHFCDDQIAWECGKLDAAESSPLGISDIEQRRGTIQTRIRLKNQTSSGDAAHEKWKRIVERYSKTSLTYAKDKLIALAGIAELMSHHIKGNYVAGMWDSYLASQLLWRVETVYRHNKFEYPSRRPKDYRAPSFSWAAVDAPQGIKCCEAVSEDRLLFKVTRIDVEPAKARYRGQVKPDACIGLECELLPVRIRKKPRIVQDDSIFTMMLTDKQISDKETQANVYLDSPVDDIGHLQGPKSSVWMMPGFKNARGYLISLLLREIDEDVYKRVGVTVNPPYMTQKSSSFLHETGRLKSWTQEPAKITVL